MTDRSSENIFAIIKALSQAKISFSLDITRDETITILATVPGQRWEIDVLGDGEVDIEVFRSPGEIFDISKLKEMIQEFAD